jgi:hypothetical protein
MAKARSRGPSLSESLLVADTAGRAAPRVHDDEDDRNGDRYQNCPKNEPTRPKPGGALMWLFPVCAHTSFNEARRQTVSIARFFYAFLTETSRSAY